jgi:hypothetical protein
MDREWRFRVYRSRSPSKAAPIESKLLTYGAARIQAQRLADQGHRVRLVDPEGNESGDVPAGAGVMEPIPPGPQLRFATEKKTC